MCDGSHSRLCQCVAWTFHVCQQQAWQRSECHDHQEHYEQLARGVVVLVSQKVWFRMQDSPRTVCGAVHGSGTRGSLYRGPTITSSVRRFVCQSHTRCHAALRVNYKSEAEIAWDCCHVGCDQESSVVIEGVAYSNASSSIHVQDLDCVLVSTFLCI